MNLNVGSLVSQETSTSIMPQCSCMPFQTIWLHTSQLTNCEWKAQAGNICVASFDWSCSGICRSPERIKEIYRKCGGIRLEFFLTQDDHYFHGNGSSLQRFSFSFAIFVKYTELSFYMRKLE